MMVNGYYQLAPRGPLLDLITRQLSLNELESASLHKAARLTDRVLLIPQKARFEYYLLAHGVLDLIHEDDDRLLAIGELINQMISGDEQMK